MSESLNPAIMLPDEIQEPLIQHFEMSEDVRIVDGLHLLTAVTTALSDRPTLIGHVPSDESILEVHHRKATSGALPQHLRARKAFRQRYSELVGITVVGAYESEVAQAVRTRLDTLQPGARRDFESRIGATQSEMIRHTLRHDPSKFDNIVLASTVQVTSNELIKSNFSARLPKRHAGAVVIAPTINDVVARCGEAQEESVSNAAFVHATVYDNEVAKGLLDGFDIPATRSFTTSDGLAVGVEQLRVRQQSDKRLRNGYGVIVAEGIGHHPIEEVMAVIDVAPSLLATRGILLLCESTSLQSGQGTVFDLINRGRKAFGHDPQMISSEEGHRMTIDAKTTSLEADGVGSRSTVFIKE